MLVSALKKGSSSMTFSEPNILPRSSSAVAIHYFERESFIVGKNA